MLPSLLLLLVAAETLGPVYVAIWCSDYYCGTDLVKGVEIRTLPRLPPLLPLGDMFLGLGLVYIYQLVDMLVQLTVPNKELYRCLETLVGNFLDRYNKFPPPYSFEVGWGRFPPVISHSPIRSLL